MSPAADAAPISDAEADGLFAAFTDEPALVIAVSGGPDSTALMALMARWRGRLRRGPDLVAVTIDHGLRPESAREARAVKRLAKRLGVTHRTLRWLGAKPTTGLQERARDARYRLLGEAARRAGARCVLTGHTRDDQAETVMIRLARGSGLTGLAAMAAVTPVAGFFLVRPLLAVDKARLIATLHARAIPFAEDPSNRDPRFTRVRMRALMPALAAEGLQPRRLALLAHRLRRADTALEAMVSEAGMRLCGGAWPADGPVAFDRALFAQLPEELALRLLGRAIAQTGDEGAVELAKLEALSAALKAGLAAPGTRLKRTLAGALVTLGDAVTVARAPARRYRGSRPKVVS